MREMPRLVSEKDGLRIYEAETVKDRHGKLIQMQLCEELVEGRWEPFYSIVTNDYLKTLKHV